MFSTIKRNFLTAFGKNILLSINSSPAREQPPRRENRYFVLSTDWEKLSLLITLRILVSISTRSKTKTHFSIWGLNGVRPRGPESAGPGSGSGTGRILPQWGPATGAGIRGCEVAIQFTVHMPQWGPATGAGISANATSANPPRWSRLNGVRPRGPESVDGFAHGEQAVVEGLNGVRPRGPESAPRLPRRPDRGRRRASMGSGHGGRNQRGRRDDPRRAVPASMGSGHGGRNQMVAVDGEQMATVPQWGPATGAGISSCGATRGGC